MTHHTHCWDMELHTAVSRPSQLSLLYFGKCSFFQIKVVAHKAQYAISQICKKALCVPKQMPVFLSRRNKKELGWERSMILGSLKPVAPFSFGLVSF